MEKQPFIWGFFRPLRGNNRRLSGRRALWTLNISLAHNGIIECRRELEEDRPAMPPSYALPLRQRGQAEIRSGILCIFSAPLQNQRSALILVAPLIAQRRTWTLSRPSLCSFWFSFKRIPRILKHSSHYQPATQQNKYITRSWCKFCIVISKRQCFS